MSSVLSDFSQELSAAVEKAGPSVVTVHARHRVPSSGILWRNKTVITADHTVRREEGITVFLPDGNRVSAKLAGRDPATDLAVLKLDEEGSPSSPQFGDPSTLKLGHFVLALGRTRYASLAASGGIVGGLGGAYRSWRGGKIDQNIRLSLDLYPGFSGGPLVSVEGKVLGVNTSGLGRGRAVTIPISTVNRTVDQLLDKGYIPRPYLGLAMQPVALPEMARGKLKSGSQGGLMVLHVEPSGPAEKAGIVLGDVIVELQGKPALDMENVRELLVSAKIDDTVKATVLRAGVPVEVSFTLGERPAR